MIARLNFLFAVAASVLIAFYMVGRYVLVEAALRIAPAVVPYLAAGFTLIALMLTVLAMAKTVIRLESTSVAARVEPAGIWAFAAQFLITLGHVVAFYSVVKFFSVEGHAGNWLLLLVSFMLYVPGVLVAISDWHKRALPKLA